MPLNTIPTRTTEDAFFYAMGAMFPMNWHVTADATGGCEVFQSPEYHCGNYTATYARTPAGYFTWHDVAGAPIADLVAKLQNLPEASPDADNGLAELSNMLAGV